MKIFISKLFIILSIILVPASGFSAIHGEECVDAYNGLISTLRPWETHQFGSVTADYVPAATGGALALAIAMPFSMSLDLIILGAVAGSAVVTDCIKSVCSIPSHLRNYYYQASREKMETAFRLVTGGIGLTNHTGLNGIAKEFDLFKMTQDEFKQMDLTFEKSHDYSAFVKSSEFADWIGDRGIAKEDYSKEVKRMLSELLFGTTFCGPGEEFEPGTLEVLKKRYLSKYSQELI